MAQDLRRRLAPRLCATCTRSRDTWLTPAAEAATMIGNAVRNSRAPFDASPVPSHRISRIMYDSGGKRAHELHDPVDRRR